MKNIALLFLLIFASTFYSQSEILDSLLQKIKSEHSLVGMSVTVVKGEDIVYSGNFGLRDIQRSLPVDGNTQYRIASISKTITAMALMKLYDEGMFSLDDDVSDYLGFQLRNPGYPDQIITVRKILSHTSSLRDGSGYSSFLSSSYNQTPPPKLETLLTTSGTYYTSNMFGSSSPNSNYFQYANINFGVAGTVIEYLSGKRFDVYVKENILEPLGLKGSFNVNTLPDINDVAVLYRKPNSTWQPQADNYKGVYPPERDLSGYTIGDNGVIFAPQGGLRISSDDLAKLMIALNNGGIYDTVRILSDTTVTKMLEKVWNYNGNNGNNYYGIFNSYALGNSETEVLLSGEVLSGHPGEAYGLISDMYFSRVKDYGIIFITNGGSWQYGSYSGWYNVEEKVYNACFDQLDELVPVTSVGQNNLKPQFKLDQNYPNPFNPSCYINYTLSEPAEVKIVVRNLLGEVVSTYDEGKRSAGEHKLEFKAENLSSGIYFCTLSDGINSQTKKMVLLR